MPTLPSKYYIIAIKHKAREAQMHKKLTINIEEQVYEGLYKVVGKGDISQFIEDIVRPYVIKNELDAAYKQMAADEEREGEALEWAEALVGDVMDEPR